MRIEDLTAEALLNSIFGSGAPATWYLGIIIAAPDAAGAGFTEPSGGSYARIPVTNNATNFPNCLANSRTKLLDTIQTFPTATADWSAVATGLGLFTVSPAGTGVCKFYLPWPGGGTRAILNGNTPTFAAQSIKIVMVP